jgi:hypothetical protein
MTTTDTIAQKALSWMPIPDVEMFNYCLELRRCDEKLYS